ncbi:alpha-glucan family phosphorylase [Bacteroidota bacterium]
MSRNNLSPDYLFEVSWEVCNKVGGIYTVISTKALTLVEELNNNYILIGPDVWRDTDDNPEFVEDKSLYSSWQEKARGEGLMIKVGRWNIAGNPIAIIVDFTPYFSQKDEVFKIFWENYKLDSLHGQWDYIEPALFGYAAAKVIESFTRFNINYNDKVVAQFHEWMCGGGLLHLNHNVAQIGTVFTTHATILGRSIAGNSLPLYSKLKEYNPDLVAKKFNVISKHSLETTSAIFADSFTTVSEITSNECTQFHDKEVDIVTPNGFEDSFVPGDNYNEKRKIARNALLNVGEKLIGEKFGDETLIIGTSGRYEFKNKGLDVFIDALSKLNNTKNLNKKVLAYILIPAGNSGPRKDLSQALSSDDKCEGLSQPFVTHCLLNPEGDPIINKLKALNINNKPEDNVKVIFVPCYLNGNDGVFNIPYYDLLIGQDLTVYASYYEPWGYTPLESLAFSIPTITTTLAGFGMWVNSNFKDEQPGIKVIERNDDNDIFVADEIAKKIIDILNLDKDAFKDAQQNAYDVSRIALWKNLIEHYYKAFKIALDKVMVRTKNFREVEKLDAFIPAEKYRPVNQPIWSRFFVHKNIPENLKSLEYLAENLWWSWNPEAEELFESIDKDQWLECDKNPLVFLENIPYSKYLQLEKNNTFLKAVQSVTQSFQSYMNEAKKKEPPKIAYFSMEYGLHTSLKIYSGGLGILAGDYLKEASDLNKDIIGVGLLYKYGYFKQLLSSKGEQVATYDAQQFSQLPIKPVRDENGSWKTITIVFPGRNIKARIWQVDVGRIHLFLLDTDFEDNLEQDRTITHHLYGGDLENRFKQEILLGVGGIRALDELGIVADVYHLNEGHAAFIGLERLRKYIVNENFTYSEAVEIVRASSLFTTHTPVPAGHDAFGEDLLRAYMAHYPARLKISWDEFMDLGKANVNDPNEKFSMSFLAANLSQEINGVSKLHGTVSQNIFKDLWIGYFPEELHIGYVTNGVHLPTWISKSWRKLLEEYLGKNFIANQSDYEMWEKLKIIPDNKIWDIRSAQKENLYDFIIDRLNRVSILRHENPKQIIEIQEILNNKALTIGFARRFATYKRAALLFRDIDRLTEIVNNEKRPVQIIFAGKAHPRDKAGQDLLKYIVDISKRPEFLGKIIFLSNYDIELAKLLVSGVDVWLNTPTRPLEASGTSGEKAVMNGGLHFSVLDGWWLEGYKPNAGWALSDKKVYDNQDFQDELDAEIIYNLLEEEIIPLYYKKDSKGIPIHWIKYIKNSMSQIAPEFTMKRMWDDYENRFYKKLFSRTIELKDNNYNRIKDITAWKKKVLNVWDNIEILKITKPEISKENIIVGKKYIGEVIIDLKELSPEDIGIELIIADSDNETSEMHIIYKKEFDLVQTKDNIAQYEVNITPNDPGVFEIGMRIFPKNESLPHRQDFALVKWI